MEKLSLITFNSRNVIILCGSFPTGAVFLHKRGCNCITMLHYCCMFLLQQVLRNTHGSDICLHGQQVEEGEELNGEDGVNLRGRQHQHSQGEQHLGITLQSPTAMPLTQKHTRP